MNSPQKLLTLTTFTFLMAACGGTEEPTSQLAFQEDVVAEVDELDVVAESDSVDEPAEVEEPAVVVAPAPSTSVPTAELTSSGTSDVAPVVVISPATETSTTTAAPTTTTTTAPTTTTTVPVAATCEGDRYTVTIPDGWYHRDCSEFSPANFPQPGDSLEREWRSEISAEFTAETPTELISRLDALSYLNVVDTIETSVDGLPVLRFTIESVIVDEDERERDAIAVDAGDGTFFISASSMPDSNFGPTLATLEERYATSIAAMEQIVSNIDIEEGVAPAQAAWPLTSLTFNPINCATGQFAFNARTNAAETGFSVESVVLQRPNQADESLSVRNDGLYQVPGWDGSQDVTAFISYSDDAGTFVKEIGTQGCADLLGGDYQICTDDDVAIAYPLDLDSHIDLGPYLDQGCAFFRYGPEDGHEDHAVTLTQYPGESFQEVRDEVIRFGTHVLDQTLPQGGPNEVYNRMRLDGADVITARIWIITDNNDTVWVLQGEVPNAGDTSAIDRLDDMAASLTFLR